MENRRKTPIPVEIQRRITKIFVTNLPEGCSGTDLASQVRLFGQIYDLYIARKRDKGGNRFGFISMLDVKNREEMLKNLRGIRMGENKLWFNIARFVLEDGEIKSDVPRQPPKKPQNHTTKAAEAAGPSLEPSVTGAWSFKDMLMGKSLDIDNSVNAFSSLHGRAVVAKMVNVSELKKIYVFLNDICPGNGKVQYLGGLDLLISFDEDSLAQNFLSTIKSMKESFSNVRIWEGQSLGFERVAWLKVQGLPLHLVTNEVINAVGDMFGKVVHSANREETDLDLSYEYVGVLVGDGKRISEEVTINCGNRKFRIWVVEEAGEWIPDFITIPSNKEDDSGSDGGTMEEDLVVHRSENSPVDSNAEHATDPISESGNPKAPLGVSGVDPVIDSSLNGDIHCPIMALNVHQSGSFLENDVSEEVSNDSFIPADEFDFDNANKNVHFSPSISKVVKRKKCKKDELGRSSLNYISSNESLKIGKKPKNVLEEHFEEDTFGLNDLLGLNVSTHGPPDANADTINDHHLDLNAQPSRDPIALSVEIEATKTLGDKLGVHLEEHEDLIQKSIIHEGLQSGKQ
ncbi:hypothetical protein SSX86_033136 [Deinandra increscens subsp. villosa]|uniref:RRM domain-containing protein n=1 Tax=Deinandra increscens subsp. villosa TaxID=3103831 RepID=A0AAP0C6H1_9ASTR